MGHSCKLTTICVPTGIHHPWLITSPLHRRGGRTSNSQIANYAFIVLRELQKLVVRMKLMMSRYSVIVTLCCCTFYAGKFPPRMFIWAPSRHSKTSTENVDSRSAKLTHTQHHHKQSNTLTVYSKIAPRTFNMAVLGFALRPIRATPANHDVAITLIVIHFPSVHASRQVSQIWFDISEALSDTPFEQSTTSLSGTSTGTPCMIP